MFTGARYLTFAKRKQGANDWYLAPARLILPIVATILLCGVDLFFRGKLEALLPEHHFITVEHTDSPELVIADIARIDPVEVSDTYPDVPILGYTNHTDT